jgi:hypothetical protein
MGSNATDCQDPETGIQISEGASLIYEKSRFAGETVFPEPPAVCFGNFSLFKQDGTCFI